MKIFAPSFLLVYLVQLSLREKVRVQTVHL